MTFKVTDALLSPMGLAMLTGAGIGTAADLGKALHAHITIDAVTNSSGEATIPYSAIANELGVFDNSDFIICEDSNTPIYGTILDGAGAGIGFADNITITTPAGVNNTSPYGETVQSTGNLVLMTRTGGTGTSGGTAVANKTVKFDMYVVMQNKTATQITIAPEDFGGYFYVEADTLFRREDTGMDMAATLTFPRVKIQSAFTISMASTGDPSTFDFTMDALPGYTRFDATKKVNVEIVMVGSDVDADSEAASAHSSHPATSNPAG